MSTTAGTPRDVFRPGGSVIDFSLARAGHGGRSSRKMFGSVPPSEGLNSTVRGTETVEMSSRENFVRGLGERSP